MKSLVVYYSRAGNTRFVAQEIAAELGSDVEEVIDLKRREGTMGWVSAGRDAMGNRETEIGETKKNLDDFDLIVIGTPIWAWSPSAPIRTYIRKHNFAGRKVALFFTLDNKPRQAVEKTKTLMPGADFVGEFLLVKPTKDREASKKKIAEWCDSLRAKLPS
jgi:flavodoxin